VTFSWGNKLLAAIIGAPMERTYQLLPPVNIIGSRMWELRYAGHRRSRAFRPGAQHDPNRTILNRKLTILMILPNDVCRSLTARISDS
jgi:hypothetical protein